MHSNALHTFSLETLARGYCELNCFRWPADCPLPAPRLWAFKDDKWKHKCPEFKALFEDIKRAVPRKEQSRAWHTLGYAGTPKSDVEFEAWWEARPKWLAELMK